MTIDILDADFRYAVSLIDEGDTVRLRALLEQEPRLLREPAPLAEDDGGYFSHPRLLWFIAENPIRNGSLPANIAEVAQTILDALRSQAVELAIADLNYTLGLVASGCVARECGVQGDLIRTLTVAGADPSSAAVAALAHRETQAAHALLDCGAAMSLRFAAGLGRMPELSRLASAAEPEALQEALALAATNGQAEAVTELVRYGADPNRFNPQGVHAHSTPLHQAVNAGSMATVRALLAAGASPEIKDRIFGGTPLDWALHLGRGEIAELLGEPGRL